LIKIGNYVNLLSLADYLMRISSWLWIFIGGAAGLATYLAYLTEPLAAYRPLSWLVAGMAGGLVFACLIALVSFSYRCIAQARLAHALAIEPKNINPLAEKFDRQQIRLSDFASPITQEYAGKTFIDCEFVGPGVIFFYRGVGLQEWRIEACDFIAVGPGAIRTGTIFSDSLFIRCHFYKVLFILAEPFASDVEAKVRGELNWLVKPRGKLSWPDEANHGCS
jgi:hypothetical protein